MYVFKAFCTRKERKLRDGQLFIFVFISVKYYFPPILSTKRRGRTNSHVFFGENKMLGSQSAAIESCMGLA